MKQQTYGSCKRTISIRRTTDAEVERIGRQLQEFNAHGRVMYSRVVERLLCGAITARAKGRKTR